MHIECGSVSRRENECGSGFEALLLYLLCSYLHEKAGAEGCPYVEIVVFAGEVRTRPLQVKSKPKQSGFKQILYRLVTGNHMRTEGVSLENV